MSTGSARFVVSEVSIQGGPALRRYRASTAPRTTEPQVNTGYW